MIEVVLNDRLGKKIRVKCKCGFARMHPSPTRLPPSTAVLGRTKLRAQCSWQRQAVRLCACLQCCVGALSLTTPVEWALCTVVLSDRRKGTTFRPLSLQRGRHHRRPQEAGRGADGHAARKDSHPEVVRRQRGCPSMHSILRISKQHSCFRPQRLRADPHTS